jgi:hypothetical protein
MDDLSVANVDEGVVQNPCVDDIMVSDKDSFDLTVYYKKEGTNIVVVPGTIGNKPVAIIEGAKSITIKLVIPDWSKSRQIIRESTYHINGVQTLDTASFRQLLFECMATSWNVVDNDGTPVQLDSESLGKTRPDIMRCFLDMLEQKLVEENIYTAILGS